MYMLTIAETILGGVGIVSLLPQLLMCTIDG